MFLMKKKLTASFDDPRSKHYFWVSDVLAIATVVSIVSIVLETVPSLAAYHTLFTIIEWTAVIIFSIEYVLRLYISKPHWRYPVSFFGVVDLVSILPTFLGLGNLTFLKSARALRIVRLLRMLRMAKLSHLRVKQPEHATGIVVLNVFIYFSVLLISMLLVGSLIYLFGSGGTTFNSIPAGMWWAFEIFVDAVTVVPTEPVASAIYVFGKFIGLLLIGVLVGVVGNLFDVLLLGKKH